jgi:hypothetical protein
MVVVEEESIIMSQVFPVDLEVEVVALQEAPALVDLEIRHQHHHHKEIQEVEVHFLTMVLMVELVVELLVLAGLVQLVMVELVLQLLGFLLLMVLQVLHQVDTLLVVVEEVEVVAPDHGQAVLEVPVVEVEGAHQLELQGQHHLGME